jgi:hypothetical protein
MITYKIGDLFREIDVDSPTIKIIPHCCNDIDAFGAGFAAAVARHYPLAKERYHQWFRLGVDIESGKPFRLGQFQSVKVHSLDLYSAIYIVNMIGQKGIVNPGNRKPVKYGHLFKCIEQIGHLIRFYLAKSPPGHQIEIETVKFGAGLAGGNWEVIEEFINDNWDFPHVPVTIWDLS